MATEIERYEKERFTSYESYYGIDIDFDHEKDVYVSWVWSEKYQANRQIEERYSSDVKELIRVILVDNFYKSLTEIKEHFNHTSDFNNPQQNLENLRVAANKKVVELLEDIL
jgi:hypothetical protein